MRPKDRVLVIQKTSAVGWTEFVVTKHMIERLLQQNISNMLKNTGFIPKRTYIVKNCGGNCQGTTKKT